MTGLYIPRKFSLYATGEQIDIGALRSPGKVPAVNFRGNRGAFRIWELERALNIDAATLKALESAWLHFFFLQV